MFKYAIYFCLIAATLANPGILTPSIGVASAPTIVSAPTLGIVRTSPLALSNGLISTGLVSNGLLSSGKLLTGGLVSEGLVTGGLIH